MVLIEEEADSVPDKIMQPRKVPVSTFNDLMQRIAVEHHREVGMLVDEVRRMRGRLSQYADVSPEPPLLSEFARGLSPRTMPEIFRMQSSSTVGLGGSTSDIHRLHNSSATTLSTRFNLHHVDDTGSATVPSELSRSRPRSTSSNITAEPGKGPHVVCGVYEDPTQRGRPPGRGAAVDAVYSASTPMLNIGSATALPSSEMSPRRVVLSSGSQTPLSRASPVSSTPVLVASGTHTPAQSMQRSGTHTPAEQSRALQSMHRMQSDPSAMSPRGPTFSNQGQQPTVRSATQSSLPAGLTPGARVVTSSGSPTRYSPREGASVASAAGGYPSASSPDRGMHLAPGSHRSPVGVTNGAVRSPVGGTFQTAASPDRGLHIAHEPVATTFNPAAPASIMRQTAPMAVDAARVRSSSPNFVVTHTGAPQPAVQVMPPMMAARVQSPGQFNVMTASSPSRQASPSGPALVSGASSPKTFRVSDLQGSVLHGGSGQQAPMVHGGSMGQRGSFGDANAAGHAFAEPIMGQPNMGRRGTAGFGSSSPTAGFGSSSPRASMEAVSANAAAATMQRLRSGGMQRLEAQVHDQSVGNTAKRGSIEIDAAHCHKHMVRGLSPVNQVQRLESHASTGRSSNGSNSGMAHVVPVAAAPDAHAFPMQQQARRSSGHIGVLEMAMQGTPSMFPHRPSQGPFGNLQVASEIESLHQASL